MTINEQEHKILCPAILKKHLKQITIDPPKGSLFASSVGKVFVKIIIGGSATPAANAPQNIVIWLGLALTAYMYMCFAFLRAPTSPQEILKSKKVSSQLMVVVVHC